ncbi:MAG: AAA family ATPase, partial [Acidobacteriota bacterium]|nr:AAA family ATPase [Acidobacteriota bacterium]
MFRLQRLEITGFKSFADYTELVFTGDGITAVVGPNGCGKSNVADAISWVLGEQRAKQLRGAEMKDVIFQGARNRAASGMAEVVLHLVRDETVEEEPDIDDIDSALEEIDEQTEAVEGKFSPELLGEAVPIEAPGAGNPSVAQLMDAASGNEAAISQPGDNGELSVIASGGSIGAPESAQQGEAEGLVTTAVGAEGEAGGAITAKTRHKRHWRPRRMALEFGPGESVSVTRRLYGSGESEYLLNNRQCRLRDIQDLFSGTGLAGAHYAIIEQGRIGQILSAKPMDRRTLIEEAAGITKFRVRQRAAEARLDGARTNLHRISDIISEIERQAGSLRRQAAKARRYAQLREELRDLLRRVYVTDEQSLIALLSELQSRLLETSEE